MLHLKAEQLCKGVTTVEPKEHLQQLQCWQEGNMQGSLFQDLPGGGGTQRGTSTRERMGCVKPLQNLTLQEEPSSDIMR